MRHYVRATTYQVAGSGHTNHPSATLWHWKVLGITAVILGLASEGLACHTPKVTPTALTYYGVQGGANPPNQALTFSRTASGTVTITASDNATWLTVSPATTSMTTSAKLTAAVNTSGRGAGTHNGTITIKMATWCTYTVPVSLVLSPSTQPPPPPTTSSATLRWNAVTGATVTGYKVYIGEAPGQYSRTITVGNVTSSTVSSLTVGRMYYFVVTAYNSAGESTPSNMVSKTIQ
jgi:Fibronectin type III domain/Viral BACON domain